MPKKKKTKGKTQPVKEGMHMMPNGMMMSDEDMERRMKKAAYHATRGRMKY